VSPQHALAVAAATGGSGGAGGERAREDGDEEDEEDEEDDDAGWLAVWFSRDGAASPAGEIESFLDRRARQLDLLIPRWSPRELAGKAGTRRRFFAAEPAEDFAAVDYLRVAP
jgi:hypothetical protein